MFRNLLLAVFCLAASILSAQNPFEGKWKAQCLLEKTDAISFEVCDLCPTKMENEKSLSIEMPEILFGKKELTMLANNKEETCMYSWNEEEQTLHFALHNSNYKFKVILTAHKDIILLKNESNSLVLLTRVNL